MTTNRINFTKKTLEALRIPVAGKRAYYRDTKVRGLFIKLTPAGKKSFYLYRKLSGKPEQIFLGQFPVMTVEQARRKASALNGEIALGKNPAQTKRKERAQWTLQQLFDEYLEHHAKVHTKYWKNAAQMFALHLKPLAAKKLSAIRRADVKAIHTELGARAPYAANRTLALLSHLFNYAIREHELEIPNPAQEIKRFKEKSRDRFLQTDELPRFFAAVAQEPNTTDRDYILISLLTGARKGNVQAMRWDEVNLERATWTIAETKTGESHTVPLVPEAVAILKHRIASATGEWVFPASGKTGHLVEPYRAWRRILKRAGIEELRIHDLRRALGSWQAATGSSMVVIGKTLAHKHISTTAIYSRLNLDPVRRSVEVATRAMLSAGGVELEDHLTSAATPDTATDE